MNLWQFNADGNDTMKIICDAEGLESGFFH
jgi:hypothetical protein